MSHVLHDKFLRKSLTKPNLWQAYKYYERRALIFGVTRITINKYKSIYWDNRIPPPS
jgi:hypothetical protein